MAATSKPSAPASPLAGCVTSLMKRLTCLTLPVTMQLDCIYRSWPFSLTSRNAQTAAKVGELPVAVDLRRHWAVGLWSALFFAVLRPSCHAGGERCLLRVRRSRLQRPDKSPGGRFSGRSVTSRKRSRRRFLCGVRCLDAGESKFVFLAATQSRNRSDRPCCAGSINADR